VSLMSETMRSQPEQLRGMLADTTGVDAAAERLRGRRLFLVGTGTSWHAANIGAWFLRAAGVEAWPVQAMDAVLYGPRPAGGDGLVLLSHKGTKTYTMKMLERARAEGVPTAVISGQGAPGAEIETSLVERSAAYTASHTGAMLRLAQLATALGADLGSLNGVPDAVEAVVQGPPIGVDPPRRAMEFVAAGPNQWTAAEGALKVRETAYVAAAGMGVEQFLHGPSVAVGRDDTLVCLDGRGPGHERLSQVARSAESAGVPVRMIAADAPNEQLSVFPLTAAVQKIALETAETLGTNPDSFGRDLPAREHALDGIAL
jgi:glucosamine--fructose-6-phosphate aminotransferase (isomerizing)